ncbi:growth arrest and DNA damage-inducible protein GADD45 beta-like isoform X1 [Acanthaster planci]|uniref:Growth arrest and DNA damage-inducible protein GADD45 beta-like isoform X1 n=1 Tax=Acanthaster planci TaxID=133434 RepID=A0A8B7ZI17_ACAPL|nr:growth arrest and DNA damage-inducible protein GADD45 beta-like isoform X1 [Acanthaster planci]
MTFEEEFDVSFKASRNCTNNMISMDARMALRELLLSAKVEGRITYGVYPSVRKLGSEPNKVMLCIHADNNADEDVALHIHFTLMEAFCREHHIRLLKVDCSENLAKLLHNNDEVNHVSLDTLDNCRAPHPRHRSNSEDFVCLLVDFPKEIDATTGCFLEHYHVMAKEMPFPHISVAS